MSLTHRLVIDSHGGVRLCELATEASGQITLWLVHAPGEPPRLIEVTERQLQTNAGWHKAFVALTLPDEEAAVHLSLWLTRPHPEIPEW